jgi:hypothetical protein
METAHAIHVQHAAQKRAEQRRAAAAAKKEAAKGWTK